MWDVVIRFLVGGAVVSAFALIGDVFKPKSFAGLFGAAPSVALATLGLTIAKHGHAYAASEARSMVAGAVAFFVYASVASWLMMRRDVKGLTASLSLLAVWFFIAFGLWAVWLR
jgi:hypothetical protein